MRLNKIVVSIFAVSNLALANAMNSDPSLQMARKQIIQQYIQDLGRADTQAIANLFTKDGIVISTSQGKIDAKKFFNAFLTKISSAHTELHQTFSSDENKDILAARFHFKFKMQNGETGEGEYVDQFIFSANSTKISQVYMFENIKYFSQNNS